MLSVLLGAVLLGGPDATMAQEPTPPPNDAPLPPDSEAPPAEAPAEAPPDVSSAPADVPSEPPPADAATLEVEREVEAYAEMSLEELLSVRIHVSVASLFVETDLEAASTVELVTEQNWRRRGARRPIDAIAHLPSTAIYPTIWGGNAVAIRGYTSTLSVRGIASLLDGVPLNMPSLGTALFVHTLELPLLSRVEMIRGPGSALYGSDAFHGVISYRSFAPDHDTAEGGVELGTDLFHQGYARMSHGLGAGLRLDVGTSYSALPDQDERYNTLTFDSMTGGVVAGTSRREHAYRAFHGYAQLRYAPEDSELDGEVAFHASLMRAYEAPGLGRGSGFVGDQDVSNSDNELYIARARIGYDLPHTLRLEASGYYWHIAGSIDTPAQITLGSMPVVVRVFGDFGESRAGTRVTLQQAENRLNTQWSFGYEFTRTGIVDDLISTIRFPDELMISPFSVFQASSGFERDIHSVLLAAQTQLFDGKLRIHYGGRLDSFSDVGTEVTPRLGIVTIPTEGIAIKALYGRAFRPPTANELRGSPPQAGGNAALRPELIDTLELVFQIERSQWKLGLTAFGSIWQEGILLTPHPDNDGDGLPDPDAAGTRAGYVNRGDNRSAGLEASFVYATEEFRVDASGSYVRSQNVDDDIQYEAFPDLILNLGAGYTWEAARLDFYVFQRLTTATTEGPPIASIPNPQRLNPYYQVTFNVSWEAVPDHLSIYLNIRNLFDLRNQVASVWNVPGGTASMPFNASIGIRGGY